MAFHWKDGWYFERLEDGSVWIQHIKPGSTGKGGLAVYDVSIIISPEIWASMASIVASVSEVFSEAEEFYNKEK